MKISNKLFSLITIIVIVIIWHLISFLNLINSFLLPPPQSVFFELMALLVTGNLINDIIATLIRTTIGFTVGIIIGIPLGILMGYYKRIYDSLEFIVDFFRSIPAIALFPLFLLFFGIGDEAKVAIAVFVVSLMILVNTMYGVRHRSRTRDMVAKTMKIERFQLFKKVIINEAKPHIFAGLRIAVSISLIVIIAAEMFIGTTVGLGYRIFNALLVYKIPEMYSVIILTGVIGYLINKLIIYVEHKQIHWIGI